MKRREVLLSVCAAGLASALPARGSTEEGAGFVSSPHAVMIDGLAHPAEVESSPPGPISARALEALRASGLAAVNVTVGGIGNYQTDFETTQRLITYWDQQIAAHPDRLCLIRAAADIQEARRRSCFGLIYGFQDATPLGDDVSRVEFFSKLGVRVFQLTYNKRNLVGDGCLEPNDAGLSQFGHAVVEALNLRNLLIDLSHASERTTRDTIARSKAPVAITHTGCAALANLPRNKTDEELKLLAERGGVAGIYLVAHFLTAHGQPTAEDFIRHIEHAVQVCGEDHVGIGSDGAVPPVKLDDEYRARSASIIRARQARGIAAPGERPEVFTFLPDLNSADRFQRIGAMLARRGHTQSRIDKLLGGNFARLFEAVWRR